MVGNFLRKLEMMVLENLSLSLGLGFSNFLRSSTNS